MTADVGTERRGVAVVVPAASLLVHSPAQGVFCV